MVTHHHTLLQPLTATDLLRELDAALERLQYLHTLCAQCPDVTGCRAVDTATERALNLLLTTRHPIMLASNQEKIDALTATPH